MTQGVVEPTRVIPPSRPIQTGRQRSFYETYNTRQVPLGGDEQANLPRGGGRLYNTFHRLPGGGQPVTVPRPLPTFLGNRSILMFAWVTAMIMVSLDEWHTHHVLPRPARLWYTSLTFGLLAIVSAFDPLVPLVSIFGVGLVIALGYQYYTGTGSFGQQGTQK